MALLLGAFTGLINHHAASSSGRLGHNEVRIECPTEDGTHVDLPANRDATSRFSMYLNQFIPINA